MLAKALLATRSSATLRALAPGLCEQGYFSRTRESVARESVAPLLTRGPQVDRVARNQEIKSDALLTDKLFGKTLRDGNSSMAPRPQNSPALQGPHARARGLDELKPLKDASKVVSRQWRVQQDPTIRRDDTKTPAAGGVKVVRPSPECRPKWTPSRPPRNPPWRS